jgi:uncharacterized SAM-binding protein YcdF (DUF218 family)
MRKFFISLAVVFGLLAVLASTVFFGLGFFLSPQDKLEQADAIVVVSGGQTTTRAEYGIKLFKQGYAPLILFSGGALDDGPSNAVAMRQQALEAGLSDDSILLEEDAQNTYENAVNSKRLLEQAGAKKIILVTSPYHQRRAAQTFKKILGEEYIVLSASAVDSRWSKSNWWKSGFSFNISMSELYKLFYIGLTGSYR